ncbi:MAG: aspartate aminotransferase family protein [Verrucomicrobia bacterium]|nr:aspartate aminotransferase family protein [Verrucomicrobiota bacterium]
MTGPEIIGLFDKYVMPTYGRYPLVFVRGKGTRVWDADGKEYLDFGGGIAVNVLGHAALASALAKQADILVHCSNLYYTEPQGLLAKKLVELVGVEGKCFFCNSGGEANEALYKLARKFGHDAGKYEVLTFTNSFHGRTLAGISATGQEKVKKGFEPMVDGFRHVPFNDLDAVAAAIGPKTAAILIEPVQGESGITPAKPEFLRGLRKLCDERGLLLMYDEVQCGIGRTGEFCAWRAVAPDVVPDAMSWAKGLAGGFPIGAAWARKPYADLLGPGSHASTFGGTPLACAVALSVIEEIEKENLMANARGLGAHLMAKLRLVPGVTAVRGLGVMIGVDTAMENRPLVNKAAARGLLLVPAGTNTVRFLPPLNITMAEADEAVGRFAEALA